MGNKVAGALAAIVPAAGESSRMGRPKPCLPWDGGTVLEAVVRALVRGGAARVIVVLGGCGEVVLDAHRGLAGAYPVEFEMNPEFRSGEMLTSIKMALARLNPDSWSGFFICPCDVPTIAPHVLRSMKARHEIEPRGIVIPTWEGRPGHPVLCPARLHGEILRHPERSGGLKAVIEKHWGEVTLVPVDCPGIQADIDTPEEYASWLEWAGAARGGWPGGGRDD